jgi:hypothetical protein
MDVDKTRVQRSDKAKGSLAKPHSFEKLMKWSKNRIAMNYLVNKYVPQLT